MIDNESKYVFINFLGPIVYEPKLFEVSIATEKREF